MRKFSIKKSYIVLFLIVLLALGLRLYRLDTRVIFDADQEFAATFAKEVLTIFPIRMIGQGLSVQSLFMGPFYFYFLVPFFAASHLHPIGGYVGSIVIGIVTIISYFFIIKSVFGTRAGLIAAFLRTILFTGITADFLMTPAFSSDLPALFTWFFLYKYWDKKDIYLLPLGFVFGLYTSFHPILFPFYLVFLIIFFARGKWPKKKYIFFSFILFLIPLTPLIVFEYFHRFTEIKILFSLNHTNNSEVKNLKTLYEYVKIIYKYPISLLYPQISETLALVISGIFYLGSGVIVCRKLSHWRNSFHLRVLISTILVFVLYYFLMPVHVPEYYFLGVFTVLFIYTVANIAILLKTKPVVGVLVLIIITVLNFQSLSDSFHTKYRASLHDKDSMIAKVKSLHPDNSTMKFYYDTDYSQHFGLGYLREYYGIEGIGGPGSPEYVIVIPSKRRFGEITLSSGSVGLIIKK